jgi:putative tryptophan/tyrosine transport system substrate-binding protein
MKRRDLILMAGGCMAAWQVPALAQPAKVWRIGFLAHGYETFYDQLFTGLKELGYEEGRNLVVERRYAEGHAERFPELTAELLRSKVDLIVVVTTPAALAVKAATKTIPVVFPNAINPVETGVVASLAHPRDNVTGGAIPTAELSAKRLELFKEVMPGLSRAAVLWNSANPSVSLGLRDTRIAADKLGIEIQPLEVQEPEDFTGAFDKLTHDRPQMLVVFQDALTLQHRQEIIAFNERQRLPAMYTAREWVREGGMMSYGENLGGMFYRAAYFVDRIFKGAKPADLPVEQPRNFDLVVNLKTAEKMGITFPQVILARADEVIE